MATAINQSTPGIIPMSPSQLEELLTAAIPSGKPILITGMPGIGKTEITGQVCKKLAVKMLVDFAALCDPTDIKGLPMAHPGDTVAKFLPFHNLAVAQTVTDRTAWFWDDIGTATPAVQSSLMNLFQQPELHRVSPLITFIAATNRRIDKGNVSGILEPFKSRFLSIVELTVDIDDWSKWAINSGIIPPQMIAFLRYRPELLAAFLPTADMTNSPTPRTWTHCAQVEALGLSTQVEAITMAGAVGHSASLEYISFRKLYKSLTLVDAVLMNPDTVTLPAKSNELYAVCSGLAHRANEQTFSRIATFATRLAVEANRGEFATMLVTDCTRRNDKVVYTDAYVRLQCGVVGQLMNGKS